MAKRPYTGFDTIAPGKRGGMETLIDLLEAHFGLWNNGSFGVRKREVKVPTPFTQLAVPLTYLGVAHRTVDPETTRPLSD